MYKVQTLNIYEQTPGASSLNAYMHQNEGTTENSNIIIIGRPKETLPCLGSRFLFRAVLTFLPCR